MYYYMYICGTQYSINERPKGTVVNFPNCEIIIVENCIPMRRKINDKLAYIICIYYIPSGHRRLLSLSVHYCIEYARIII